MVDRICLTGVKRALKLSQPFFALGAYLSDVTSTAEQGAKRQIKPVGKIPG